MRKGLLHRRRIMMNEPLVRVDYITVKRPYAYFIDYHPTNRDTITLIVTPNEVGNSTGGELGQSKIGTAWNDVPNYWFTIKVRTDTAWASLWCFRADGINYDYGSINCTNRLTKIYVDYINRLSYIENAFDRRNLSINAQDPATIELPPMCLGNVGNDSGTLATKATFGFHELLITRDGVSYMHILPYEDKNGEPYIKDVISGKVYIKTDTRPY